MNEGLIPQRYARALWKFASEKGVASKVYDLTNRLCESFAMMPEMQKTMANPFIAPDKKIQILTSAAGASDADTVYSDFLHLLDQNKRLPLVRDIAHSYTELYRKENNFFHVDVVSAAALSEDVRKRIEKIVANSTGNATLEYSFKVDPELIGGFTITIGSKRLDASVRNELKQLSLSLLG